jgi:hypothetical protein
MHYIKYYDALDNVNIQRHPTLQEHRPAAYHHFLNFAFSEYYTITKHLNSCHGHHGHHKLVTVSFDHFDVRGPIRVSNITERER